MSTPQHVPPPGFAARPSERRNLWSAERAVEHEPPPDFEALAREHRGGYPPGFWEWPPEWRDDYFGAASRLCRERKTDSQQSAPGGTGGEGSFDSSMWNVQIVEETLASRESKCVDETHGPRRAAGGYLSLGMHGPFPLL